MNHTSDYPKHLAIVMPCLNDSASLIVLVQKITQLLGEIDLDYRIFIADDGSSEEEIETLKRFTGEHPRVDLLVSEFKSGHQNAILRTLIHIDSITGYKPDVVIMDSDGEDNPEHIPVLIEALRGSDVKAVLARRGIRHSGLKFSILHKLFNVPFRLLTGRKLETGNFMILRDSWIHTLIRLPSTSNHISATVLRFSPSYKLVTLDRSRRYAGQSRMNLGSLSLHGYGALATFADVALSRLVIAITALGALLLGVALILISLKIFVGVHFLPGWTSNAVIQLFSLTLVTVVQAVTTTIIILWTKNIKK